MAKQRGFSLIELLIVVAIILIIAAIAIPNLMRSRIAANNSAAAATVRTLNTAEATYNSTYNGAGFATLAQLGPGAATCGTPTSTNACIVDFVLGCSNGTSGQFCQRDQFFFEITINSSGADYVIVAWPTAPTQGNTDYCSAPDMVVRSQTDNAPSAGGPGTNTDALCQGGSYLPI